MISTNACQRYPLIYTAISRQNPSQDQTKFPLTLPTIQQMLALLSPTDTNSQVLRALITWLYTGANRSVEVIPKVQTDYKAAVQLNHIKFYHQHGSHYMIYSFRNSKNNKTKQKQAATFPCLCKWNICAVQELLNYLKLRKLESHAALFVWQDKTLVTYRQLLTRVRSLLSRIPLNLDPQDYGLHSFRKGCILDSIRLEVPLSICKQIGNWKCVDSVDPYMKVDSHQLVQFRQTAIDTKLTLRQDTAGSTLSTMPATQQPATQSHTTTEPSREATKRTSSHRIVNHPRQQKPAHHTTSKKSTRNINSRQYCNKRQKAANQTRHKPKRTAAKPQVSRDTKPRKSKQKTKSKARPQHTEESCPCGKSSTADMAQCTLCDQWWHFKCQRLSKAEIATLSDSDAEWFCSNCVNDASD